MVDHYYADRIDKVTCAMCGQRIDEDDARFEHGKHFCGNHCCFDQWAAENLFWCTGCAKHHWTADPMFVFDDVCLCEDAFGDEIALQEMLKHIAGVMTSTAKMFTEPDKRK